MNRKKKLNKLGLNDCFMDKKNPFELFKVWMSKAKKTEINDPNALADVLAALKMQILRLRFLVFKKDQVKSSFFIQI